MFTDEGLREYKKWEKWISDESFQFSPNFVPTEETPKEAAEYYKYMLSDVVDFESPDFKWPTGVGMNC